MVGAKERFAERSLCNGRGQGRGETKQALWVPLGSCTLAPPVMADPSNPYRPPAEALESPARKPVGYMPLGSRTTIVSFFLLASVVLDVLSNAGRVVGIQGTVRMATLSAVVGMAAAVGYCVWIHRAARNLRALGRERLVFTPGWCIGWFFVPIANLYKPYRAVAELWQASDPDLGSDRDSWGTASLPSVLGPWWGFWILSNAVGNAAARLPVLLQGVMGPVSCLLTGVAAVLCVVVMRGIDERQRGLAARGAGR